MATNILMPKWGMSMKEGRIANWLKSAGDSVNEGEPIVEIESDKAVNFVEAPVAGVLAQIVVEADETVDVSTVIAVIAAPGEEVDLTSQVERGTSVDVESSEPTAESSSSSAAKAKPKKSKRVPASPAAKRLAKEKGIDLATINGTGPKGMITVEDVESAQAGGESSTEPITKINFYSDNIRLSGVLYRPSNAPEEGAPVFVLCHGCTYTMNLLVADIAKRLAELGYAALIFDYRGFGESDGERGRLQPWEQLTDIRAAVSWLHAEPGIDSTNIGLLGISLGGGHAISVAAVDPRVSSVIAIAPVTDGWEWLRGMRHQWQWDSLLRQIDADRERQARGNRSEAVDPWSIIIPDPTSAQFLDQLYVEFPDLKCDVDLAMAGSLLEYSPVGLNDDIDVPMLLIHGDEDQVVPISQSQLLLETTDANTSLVVVAGMDHFQWGVPGSQHFETVITAIEDWLS